MANPKRRIASNSLHLSTESFTNYMGRLPREVEFVWDHGTVITLTRIESGTGYEIIWGAAGFANSSTEVEVEFKKRQGWLWVCPVCGQCNNKIYLGDLNAWACDQCLGMYVPEKIGKLGVNDTLILLANTLGV